MRRPRKALPVLTTREAKASLPMRLRRRLLVTLDLERKS